MRKLFRMFSGLILVLAAFVEASATDVIFEFGPAIERRLERLEASERRREEHFRDRWNVEASRSPQIWYAYSTSSERLIPDMREYTLQTLAERMIRYNLDVIEQGNSDNTLIIKVNDFYGGSFRLPAFQGDNGNALMKGEITLLDAAGNTLYYDKLWVRTRKRYEKVTHYLGNGHPYPSYEFVGSFGAMLSVFLHRVMSDAYPGTEVPEPIVMRGTRLTPSFSDRDWKSRQKRFEKEVNQQPESGR